MPKSEKPSLTAGFYEALHFVLPDDVDGYELTFSERMASSGTMRTNSPSLYG